MGRALHRAAHPAHLRPGRSPNLPTSGRMLAGSVFLRLAMAGGPARRRDVSEMRTARRRRRTGCTWRWLVLDALALVSPAGATPIAASSGAGRLTYERINQAMAAQSSVTYSTAITFEGVPILTGGASSWDMPRPRPAVAPRRSTTATRRSTSSTSSGTQGRGCALWQQRRPRRGRPDDPPSELPPTLTLPGLLSPYGPSGALWSLGTRRRRRSPG